MGKSEKSIIKFIVEQHTRLSAIIRYNNTPKIVGESVAEHSYYVTFLAMVLADYVREQGMTIDKERVMEMALVHDLEEIISGDIIRVLKSGGFKSELDRMNEKSMQHMTEGLAGAYAARYYSCWKEAKDKLTKEALLVDLSDLCSAIIYCIREIHLGNNYFKEILEYCIGLLPAFFKKIPEVKKLLQELSSYCLSYLKEDEKLYDSINSAVRRFYEYGTEDEEKEGSSGGNRKSEKEIL